MYTQWEHLMDSSELPRGGAGGAARGAGGREAVWRAGMGTAGGRAVWKDRTDATQQNRRRKRRIPSINEHQSVIENC